MSTREPVSEQDRALFRRAVGAVRPIDDERHHPPRQPKMRQIARQAGPEPDIASISPVVPDRHATGDVLSFVRPGLPRKQLRRLRRGQVPVEADLDLHGMSTEQAHAALLAFLRRARDRQWRCVRIIHGKGYGSRRGGGVIKARVDRWLRMRPQVVAFCSARPTDGGTGAIYVLLRG